jgi:hypothetical protein
MMFQYEEEVAGGRKRRNAIAIGSSEAWPNGIVPFNISSTFSGELGKISSAWCGQFIFCAFIAESERRVVFQSMQHWEEFTCVRFRPKTDSDTFGIDYETGPPRVYVGERGSRLCKY